MKKKAFTLIEVLVGISLFTIIFLGIISGFLLGFRVIGISQRKIVATQIAQGEIEKIKNMAYLDIGTIGAQLPYASGTLESSTTTILNGIEYKIERLVKFISDPTDEDEECFLDYKKVKISVSFSGILAGEIVLTTDIAPKDKVEEVQACLAQPAGILSVQVLNFVGQFVQSPTIEIYSLDGSLIDSASPNSGKYDFPLSPGNYKVKVFKTGFSSEETFSVGEEYNGKQIAIPEKPNPIVLEGQITQISFLIDKISSLSIKTLSTFSQGIFFDTFNDESKVSQIYQVSIFNSEATLATSSDGYFPTGFLLSIEISPSDLIEWQEFSFNDEEPEETDLKYQFFYPSSSQWLLIPDSDLPGNSNGFDVSPVNLSSLATTTYFSLKIKANFSTQSTSSTPILKDWQLTWKNSQSVAIANVLFNSRGSKIVGQDSSENPIFKFSTTTQTNSSGEIQIEKLEGDIYYFSDFKKDSQVLNLVSSIPEHPINLNPDTNLDVLLYLEAQHSLLVTVLDSENSNPILSATTTLTRLNFSQTQYTNIKGQTIFIPLISQSYNLNVEADGYYPTSTTIFVSGQTTKLIKLDPLP